MTGQLIKPSTEGRPRIPPSCTRKQQLRGGILVSWYNLEESAVHNIVNIVLTGLHTVNTPQPFFLLFFNVWLSFFFPECLSLPLYLYQTIYPHQCIYHFVYKSVFKSIKSLPFCSPTCLSVFFYFVCLLTTYLYSLPVCLSVTFLSVCLLICLPIYLSAASLFHCEFMTDYLCFLPTPSFPPSPPLSPLSSTLKESAMSRSRVSLLSGYSPLRLR